MECQHYNDGYCEVRFKQVSKKLICEVCKKKLVCSKKLWDSI
jgi:hypothetical protein